MTDVVRSFFASAAVLATLAVGVTFPGDANAVSQTARENAQSARVTFTSTQGGRTTIVASDVTAAGGVSSTIRVAMVQPAGERSEIFSGYAALEADQFVVTALD